VDVIEALAINTTWLRQVPVRSVLLTLITLVIDYGH